MNVFVPVNLDLLYDIPVMCPVSGCQSQMPPLGLLTHLLMRHSPQESFTEINAEWPKLSCIELCKLSPGRNHVVAAIAYGGSPKPGRSCPVTPELQVVHHLPLLVVLYVSPPTPNLEQAYIFYLVSPVTSSKVSAHVTLLDGCSAHETRGLRCLRNFLNTPLQDSEELLYCNMDFLLYTATDIRELCITGKQRRFVVKVLLHGEPDLFEVEPQLEAPW